MERSFAVVPLLIVALAVFVQPMRAAESWIDILSGEHFDDIVGTTDGSKLFTIPTVLMLYKPSCAPNTDLKKNPPTNNIIYFQHDTERSQKNIWYKPLATDNLRKRYAQNDTRCQVAVFFAKGKKLYGKPSKVWDRKAEPDFDVWMWSLVKMEITIINKVGQTLGITQKRFEFAPKLKYEFLYPDEELVLKTNPGYEIVISSTDRTKEYFTFIATKKERIIIEDGMELLDIQQVKRNEFDKADWWIMYAKHNSIRHLTNMKQPLFVHNYTVQGYKVREIPGAVLKSLTEHYKLNKDSREYEDTSGASLITDNRHEVKTSIVTVPDTLVEAISSSIVPLVESFCQCKLDHSATYGIRELYKGNIIRKHVSYVNAYVLTAILHLTETPDNTSAPVEMITYGGKRIEVETKPGQMIIMETTKVIHGRPKPFMGKTMTILEMSYMPRQGWDYHVDGIDLVNEKTGEEEPLWQKDTQLMKKNMFSRKDEL